MRPRIDRSGTLFHLIVLLSLAPAVSAAQTRSPDERPQERPRPVATAAPRSGPVRLDGHLDEAAWETATPAVDFTQQRPNEAAPASEKTEVRFLYDESALYIGARMYDAEGAAGVRSRLVRRDQAAQSDALRIDFDPYHDRITSVQFVVNPAGWRADAVGSDFSWDPVWETATSIDSLGWTAEIRIPFSQLRFSRDSVQTWGLNITRVIDRKQERSQWSFWRQNEPGGPAFFGELTGLKINHVPQHAELLPYVVARNERLSSGNPQSPFYDPNSAALRLGGDLKYLVTSNLTLSATVNPDFGQVEVDPAVVNLSAFETFFPERRPFFVEGADLFRFGSPGCNISCGPGLNLFYSRRVGRAPQGSSLAFARGPYADIPENTTILGAAKLTGRTRKGYTVGLLNAVTRRETAEVATEAGQRLIQVVEPLTNSFTGRVRREMNGGNLVLGGILTSVNRDLNGGLSSLLPNSAQTTGMDVEYSWKKRTYTLYAALAASHVAGDSTAILRIQRSSARYLQRPDREPASNGLFSSAYDPSATDFAGYGGVARVAKQGGNWLWDLNLASLSPGLETNDMGFQQLADWRWVNGTFGRRFTRPTRRYRTMMLMGGAEQQWNYDGDLTRRDVSGLFTLETPKYWSTTLFVIRNFSSMADRLTRGGPVVQQAGSTVGSFSLSTDPRKPVVLRGSFQGTAQDDGGSDLSSGLTATVRAAPNVLLTLGPNFRRLRATDQYVGSVADPTATAFYGRRYIFAHIDQTQLSMTTRASVTFTPDLSLELFAQPLLASADYHEFEEFAAPRRREKLVYGRDIGTVEVRTASDGVRYVVDPDAAGPARSFTIRNPDFNLRSLRGTGVLRWEWRPGSTAYLVWTQTRSERAAVGDFDFGRDQTALLRAPADNILVLKISYWVGL